MKTKQTKETLPPILDPFKESQGFVKILLPAKFIPHKSTVLKLRGERVYTLSQSLTVYTVEKTPMNFNGCFLSSNGDINQVDPETILVWQVSLDVLQYYLNLEDEGTPQ